VGKLLRSKMIQHIDSSVESTKQINEFDACGIEPKGVTIRFIRGGGAKYCICPWKFLVLIFAVNCQDLKQNVSE